MPSTATLLLRLEGPVQSWGDASSRWDHRPTGPRPTKSGVVGLIANAMGRTYDTAIDDLAALRFAVRADRPGHIELDFRTAGGATFPLDASTRWHNRKLTDLPDKSQIPYGAPRASANNAWTAAGRSAVFRPNTYLADSAFVASVTGDAGLVNQIAQALDRPARLLCLGRRANPPAQEVLHTVLDGDCHERWPEDVPLLASATATRPHTWFETSTTSDGQIFYEQPVTGGRGRPQQPLRLVHRRVMAPVAAQERI